MKQKQKQSQKVSQKVIINLASKRKQRKKKKTQKQIKIIEAPQQQIRIPTFSFAPQPPPNTAPNVPNAGNNKVSNALADGLVAFLQKFNGASSGSMGFNTGTTTNVFNQMLPSPIVQAELTPENRSVIGLAGSEVAYPEEFEFDELPIQEMERLRLVAEEQEARAEEELRTRPKPFISLEEIRSGFIPFETAIEEESTIGRPKQFKDIGVETEPVFVREQETQKPTEEEYIEQMIEERRREFEEAEEAEEAGPAPKEAVAVTPIQELEAFNEKFKEDKKKFGLSKETLIGAIKQFPIEQIKQVERMLDERYGNINKSIYKLGDNAKGNRSPFVTKENVFSAESSLKQIPTSSLYLILENLKAD